MMLKSKRVVEVDEFKLVLLAIKAPHDGAILPVYLEKSAKVAAGDQIITGIILLHGIEMEVIPGRFNCKAVTSFVEAASFIVAFGKVGIIKGSPFKEHFAGLNVDLLKEALQHPAHWLADAISTQVVLDRLKNCSYGGAPGKEGKLMNIIGGSSVSGLNRSDCAVGAIHNNTMTSTTTNKILSVIK